MGEVVPIFKKMMRKNENIMATWVKLLIEQQRDTTDLMVKHIGEQWKPVKGE